MDIVNPGTHGAGPGGAGDLCALIYVVDPAEELRECCGCLLSPDQALELSVQNDLDANPSNGTILHNGALKIISSTPTTSGAFSDNDNSVCDPGPPVPTPMLRAWFTYVRNFAAGNGRIQQRCAQRLPLFRRGEFGSLANHLPPSFASMPPAQGRRYCPNVFTYANTFSYTAGPQTFTVPVSGTYHIVANGAQGGSDSIDEKDGGLGDELIVFHR